MSTELGVPITERIYTNKAGEPYRLRELFSREVVEARITELGQQISRDYAGKKVTLVAPLKGGIAFLLDLMRKIDHPDLQIGFVEATSYKDETSPGAVVVTKDFEPASLEGRELIIAEDIIDFGHTMAELLRRVSGLNVNSTKVAALLSKPSRREIDIPIDYLGFEIANEFVVGWGLDYQQNLRQLHAIYVVEILTATSTNLPS